MPSALKQFDCMPKQQWPWLKTVLMALNHSWKQF